MMIRVCEWLIILASAALAAPYLVAASSPGVAVSLKPWCAAAVIIVDITGAIVIALLPRARRPVLIKLAFAAILVPLLVANTLALARMDDLTVEISPRGTGPSRVTSEPGL